MKFQLTTLFLLCSFIGLTNQSAQAQGVAETIAKTGDAAADGNGSVDRLSVPKINAAGMTAFQAFFTGTSGGVNDDSGLFKESSGEIARIAREGQVNPGGDGVFAYFLGFDFNDLGETAFVANISETNSGNRGIFLNSDDGLNLVARRGQSVPGGNGMINIIFDPKMNNSGTVAFAAVLSGTDDIGNNDDAGIYQVRDGMLTEVMRKGGEAPDGNGIFSEVNDPVLNDAGDIAFYANFDQTSGGISDNAAIFRETNGAMTPVVRKGQIAPDGNGTFSELGFANTLNESGFVAFSGQLTGTDGGQADDRGIFVGDGGEVIQVARRGQAVADGNGVFSSFYDLSSSERNSTPVLNNSGTVAFASNLTGTSGGNMDDSGIFTGDGGAISQIVREGQAAPDGNGVFASFLGNYNLNDNGVVAFQGNLSGTNNGTNDDGGLYLSDGIDLIQVARKGDSSSGSTILEIQMDKSAGLNNFGQVAYQASSVDGSQSLHRFTPDLYWRSTTSDDWSNKSNWTLGLSPSLVHNVNAQSDSDVSISGPASGVVKSLQVGSVAGLDRQGLVALNLDGGNLTATHDAIVNSTGTITVAGEGSFHVGTNDLSGSGARIVLGDSTGHGNLSVLGGGTINNEGTVLIGSDSGFTGTALVSGAGSSWSNEASVDIGLSGTGTLTVADGGLFTSGNARVGFNSGGEGSVTISGSNSRWQGGSLDFGSSGTADLVVESGGVLASSNLMLGRFGEATAIVTGSGSRIEEVGVGSGLRIGWGSGGSGALAVENGAVVDGHGAQIAIGDNSTGSVHVTGSGSTWQSSELITLGSRGEGTLLIDNGGRVFNESSSLAFFSSGVANVSVSGNSSSWIHERGLTLGGAGTAVLEVSDQALVKVDSNDFGFSTSIGQNSLVKVNGGRFEFGQTDFLGSYSRISGAGGSLEGNVVVVGDRTVESLDDYSKSGLNTLGVRHGNANLITGSGVSLFGLTNFANGELRTESGESVQFGGFGSSNRRNGLVNNQGGEVVFKNDFRNRNAGDIVGYGSFGFGGGLTNEGTMSFGGGDTVVDGSVVNENLTNAQEGRIITSGGSSTLFTGAVIHNGNRIETEAGGSTTFANVYSGAGRFTGTGDVIFEDVVRLGNSPAEVGFAGDVFLGSESEAIVELGGVAIGEFDRFNISGDFHLGGILSVATIDGFGLQLNDQFEIAEVDGVLSGQFLGLGEGDLVGVYGGFELSISYFAGDGNDIALFASASAVPEPGAMTFLLLTTGGLMIKRRRRICVC